MSQVNGCSADIFMEVNQGQKTISPPLLCCFYFYVPLHHQINMYPLTYTHKPHAEIINHECSLVAWCTETVCRCDAGGRQKDKRKFIWDSCIEHHVRIRQKVTEKNYTNPTALLLLKTLNGFQVEHGNAKPLYLIPYRLQRYSFVRRFYCCSET